MYLENLCDECQKRALRDAASERQQFAIYKAYSDMRELSLMHRRADGSDVFDVEIGGRFVYSIRNLSDELTSTMTWFRAPFFALFLIDGAIIVPREGLFTIQRGVHLMKRRFASVESAFRYWNRTRSLEAAFRTLCERREQEQ